MRAISLSAVVLAMIAGFVGVSALTLVADGRRHHENKKNLIEVLDTCLPGDPGWNPSGGCTLSPEDGDVSFAEFGALLRSPLTVPPNGALVGHPAWRNEPSHLSIRQGKTIHIVNNGGRGHTFTEVANFGGGFVPPLNIGLTPAPECTPATTVPLPPGASDKLEGLAPGLHKFECCIHPWMRATIRVEPR